IPAVGASRTADSRAERLASSTLLQPSERHAVDEPVAARGVKSGNWRPQPLRSLRRVSSTACRSGRSKPIPGLPHKPLDRLALLCSNRFSKKPTVGFGWRGSAMTVLEDLVMITPGVWIDPSVVVLPGAAA